MTKEDWGKVEKALSGTYGHAVIQVDGREVYFQRGLVTKNRLGIVTYIDGQWKGAWISGKEEYPEQKYLRPATRFMHSAKRRAEFKKWPKRIQKLFAYDVDEKLHYYDLIWPSVTAIRRHYEKTFQSIELVKVLG